MYGYDNSFNDHESNHQSENKSNDNTSNTPSFASSCGFPNPAEDSLDIPLDLNELLIQKPAATFFIRAKGESMEGAGIFANDILIIDRSIKAIHNNIILAVLDGEFLIRRLHLKNGQPFLLSANPKYKPLPITEHSEFLIWGVATTCLHNLR